MSEQAGYSPSFKRPSEILRMRRKRARSEGVASSAQSAVSNPGLSIAGVRPFSPGPLSSAQGKITGGVKRRNPFANIENTFNSPKKRVISCSDADADALVYKRSVVSVECKGENVTEQCVNSVPALSFSEQLLDAVRQSKDVPKKASVSEDDSLFEEDSFEDRKSTPILKSPQAQTVSDEASVGICSEYPADWSLKTRLLFTSPQSFSWAEHPRAQEEAQGLSQHCRAQHASIPQNIQDPRGCTELRYGFQQCLQYWQHPSLPWLPLFPRIGAERKFSGKATPWAQDSALQQSLMSEWSSSLTSLYSLVKARLCPYFYICSYQFTVLFRAAGLSGTTGITALLSPTTRGLREAMKADGIEFTLPLLEEKKKSKESSSSQLNEDSQQTEGEEERTADDCDNDDDDDDDEEDGGFSWLKEMGVQDKIKKPDALSIKLRKEHSEVRLDHRPESVVLVEGSNTFTLLNFLINCKSLVAAAGCQAGLPPTLLAPTAFRGATLQTLKARCVNVKTQVRTGYQDVCSLEVTGPIMPHAVHSLTQLLRPSQRGSFSVGLYTHEPTAVLNVPVCKISDPRPQDAVVEDLSRCGLQQSTVKQLSELSTLGKSALRQLHMRDYSYTWRT
ncbi:protein downstream neighbor of son homolog [Chanos chanos]|uniref:Protein downstream neighbor of son homolog n=1 Tax=Chanos chanos TaxID=29144 RepID=A0A6J2W0F6_CHACN|nr:protein downstream neighbor of Son [Chanos chanos]